MIGYKVCRKMEDGRTVSAFASHHSVNGIPSLALDYEEGSVVETHPELAKRGLPLFIFNSLDSARLFGDTDYFVIFKVFYRKKDLRPIKRYYAAMNPVRYVSLAELRESLTYDMDGNFLLPAGTIGVKRLTVLEVVKESRVIV